MSVDKISNATLEAYLSEEKCLTCCGGIHFPDSNFVHFKEGRMSTARGMTLEYTKDMDG